jgi:hypothetical protein
MDTDDIVLVRYRSSLIPHRACIEVGLLFLATLFACDVDEKNIVRAIYIKSGVPNDEVRFGVLLIDLITIRRGTPKADTMARWIASRSPLTCSLVRPS